MGHPGADHDDARHRAWRMLLDELEAEAHTAGALAAGPPGASARGRSGTDTTVDAADARAAGTETTAPHGADATWQPPHRLGALPPCLAGRAAEVRSALARAAEDLHTARDTVRRHESALAAVPRTTGTAPVYLDVVG